VDSTPASLTAATAGVAASVAGVTAVGVTNAGQTFTLTTDADELNGTSGNDTFTGGVNSMDGADIVDGGEGTDVLNVRMDANDTMGIVESVETINLISRGDNGAAPISFADVTGVVTVGLTGTTNFDVTALSVDTAFNITDSDVEFTLGFSDDAGDADNVAVTVNAFEGTLTTEAAGNNDIEQLTVTASGAASDFTYTDSASTLETLTVKGDQDVAITLTAVATELETINAADATGNVEVTLAVATDLAITLGAGDDTVNAATFLNSNDSITDGEGDDTVVAELAGTTVRPTMSGVENLELEFANAGTTFDMRNITGAATLTLTGDEAATITRAAASVATINIEEAANTENYSVTYATGADAAVTVNVGATNDDGDAVVAAGTVTLAGNAGALTINSIGDDDNSTGNITANDVASVTINAATVGFSLGTNDISATDATAFTVNATGADITFDDATLTAAAAIALNATGGAIAAGDLTTAEDGATVTVVASGSDDNDVTIALIDADFATSFDFTASGGSDITVTDIETLGENSDGDDIDNEINITANGEGSTAAVTIDAFAAAGVVDLVTLVSDADGTVSFTVGTGTNVTISEVDATGSAGTTTIDLSGVTVASEVATGAGGSTTTLTSAADTFIGGAGDDDLAASDGADDITLGGGEDTVTIGFDGAPTIQDFNVDDDAIIIDNSIAAADNAGVAGVDIGGDTIGVENGSLHFFSDGANISALTANILVFDTAEYGSNAALATAIETGGAQVLTTDIADDDFFIAIYTDGSDAFIVTISNEETADNTVLEAGDAIIETIATLVGVNDLTTLANGNFSFVA
jgi:hypothetical protein